MTSTHACHPPVLEQDDVRLRDLTAGDLPRVADLLDPARPWHATNGPYFAPMTRQDVDAYVARLTADVATDPADRALPRRHLAVVDAATDLVLGQVTWYWESAETDWRRLGLVLWDETCWGRGVGTTALTLWTDHLFATTDALRLDLATYSGNPGMIRAALKAGYVEEGRMRRARRWAGGVHDAVVLGVLRDEWDALRSRASA
ncbi:GNAT family N-acetyltransferase [Cellulomonas sp. P22]|uniref:GNAT family N-acetyltransferase n=1 Tax=Cellulomonas sp. P22 TaxID=3373189 RepID=UPI0037A9FE00